MNGNRLDGRVASKALLEKLHLEWTEGKKKQPSLVILQVGNHAASTSYIKQKKKSALLCGFKFEHRSLSSDLSYQDLEAEIDQLNKESSVDAFMLQLPLDIKDELSSEQVHTLLERISPDKDADGLHSSNLGKLFCAQSLAHNWTSPMPATALGIMRLLEHYDISVESLNVSVIGKSRLVGMPTAALMAHSGATVTLCHRLTKNLKASLSDADLIVVAAGKKHLVDANVLKHKAIVIDVGIHKTEEGLTGDLNPELYDDLQAYSPVPGGVGPMTVAGLMENTARLAWRR